ncbi:MAG: PSD1 domain-containing protein [Planctomycetaceae bacterium]|nr:PSD1 domain-containing protein [Planctomycetaceae bacterium]
MLIFVVPQMVVGSDVDFRRDIRPILSDKCFQCHGPDAERESDLRLDLAESVLAQRDGVAAVVPHDVQRSLLYQRITSEDVDDRMPPVDSGKSLTPHEIDLLRQWIEQGAEWAGHWSFEKLSSPEIPPGDTDWSRNTIDRFVSQRLSEAGLTPSPAVDRRTFIRRLSFDLLGLPPMPSDVDAFVCDERPDAVERLVDRYLSSPAFGERWGRVWLDLARYTDTTAEWLNSTGQAWLYRDWVVRAMNEDMPYDHFVRLQLAADAMPDVAIEDLPALGFLGLSPTYWKELRLSPDVIKRVVADEWDERIDTVSRTFLGLTVSCARCHDHKFDPISSEDYYALAGVFASSQFADRPLLPEAEAKHVMQAREQVHELEAQRDKLKRDDTEGRQAIEQQIAEIRKSTLHFDAVSAHVMQDSSIYVVADGPDLTKLEYREGEARDLPKFERGNPASDGPVVERRFLTALSSEEPRRLQHGSGRLDLADALFSEARGLTARVIVNRIWEQHFGKGLVRTPSDFGSQGDPPSHPELLDHLAAELIRHDWSLKRLHREIVLSSTYRQSSVADGEGQAVDPANRLLWRMNRRRLEVEMLRDAMLAATEQLDRCQGGPAFDLQDTSQRRRTLYGQIARRDLDRVLRLFDFPEPTSHAPHRVQTTTPLQQLFLLNAPFVQQQAESLALSVSNIASEQEFVRACYRQLFHRDPDEAELAEGVAFLSTEGDRIATSTDYVHALLGLNEFLYID